MVVKLAAFSGKSEDCLAGSTKLVAMMHPKGLFRTMIDNDDLLEAEPTPPDSSSGIHLVAYDTKMQ